MLALGLDPPVTALVARGWPRGRAALATFAGLFVAVFVIVLVTAGPLWDQIIDFVQQLPTYWDELTHTDGFQQLINTAGADDTIRNALKDLAAGLPEAATAILGIAGGVFGSILSLVTLTFLALFLLMERPTITDWLFGFAPPAVERRWHPVLEESHPRGLHLADRQRGDLVRGGDWSPACRRGRSVCRSRSCLAVITGLLDLIPQVGATVAAVILVAVALTVCTPAAIVMLVIQLVYQQIENYVVYPIVYRRAVELSPFTTIVAVLIAGSLLGVVGAILAVPFAAMIKIIIREAGAPRRTRMEALRTVDPDTAATPLPDGDDALTAP